MIQNPKLALELELDKDKLAELNMTIEDAFSIFRERFSKFGLKEMESEAYDNHIVFITDGSEKGMAMIGLADDVLLDELPWFKKCATKMNLWVEDRKTHKFILDSDCIQDNKEEGFW